MQVENPYRDLNPNLPFYVLHNRALFAMNILGDTKSTIVMEHICFFPPENNYHCKTLIGDLAVLMLKEGFVL